MTYRGTEEVGAIFYGTLNDKGDVGFRPARFGRFTLSGLEVTGDRIELHFGEAGTVRLHSSHATLSYALA